MGGAPPPGEPSCVYRGTSLIRNCPPPARRGQRRERWGESKVMRRRQGVGARGEWFEGKTVYIYIYIYICIYIYMRAEGSEEDTKPARGMRPLSSISREEGTT